MEVQDRSTAHGDEALATARLQFREALLASRALHKKVGEVEAMAAQYCEAMREAGFTPQGMLIDAKKVIEDTIDGDDVPVAQRAIASCIERYYRT